MKSSAKPKAPAPAVFLHTSLRDEIEVSVEISQTAAKTPKESKATPSRKQRRDTDYTYVQDGEKNKSELK